MQNKNKNFIATKYWYISENYLQNAVRHSEKPKPPLKPKPLPLVEALYPYEAQDTDELSFTTGDKFELVNKGQYLHYNELIQISLID